MDEGKGKMIEVSELSAEERIAMLTEQLAEARRELAEERAERQKLQQQHQEDLKLIAELKEAAIVDPLTNLRNRRGVALEVTRMLDENRTLEKPEHRKKKSGISLLLLDIDHFKNINDTYGHDIGDVVLQAAAAMLRQSFRKGDVVGRDGGEEFVCILSGVDARTAYEVLLRKFGNTDPQADDYLQISFTVPTGRADAQGDPEMVPVTFSGGIVDLKEGDSYENAHKTADELLYQAKESGRNRILM